MDKKILLALEECCIYGTIEGLFNLAKEFAKAGIDTHIGENELVGYYLEITVPTETIRRNPYDVE